MYQTRILEHQDIIDRLVSEIANSVFEEHPGLVELYGEKGRSQAMADLQKHFHFLQTAFRMQAPEIFTDHVKWLYNVLSSRRIDIRYVITGLSEMKKRVGQLPPVKESFYCSCISEAIHWLSESCPS
ncbi:hypothetical protein D3H55_00745 [Bacillus salacetis]|uniref:Uncharacterized protein n=1 Tax=Bacillus salacetis TaxID=2315464 RepID=A0A3A1RBW5_9BACI|nr:hypothetical protein [Bacillus salacetis]RIW38913.1 hypothetical protein D3H55_00745 [Bacillus salacetis]